MRNAAPAGQKDFRSLNGERRSSAAVSKLGPWIRAAVVVHEADAPVDGLLAEFALTLRDRGFNVVGYVKHFAFAKAIRPPRFRRRAPYLLAAAGSVALLLALDDSASAGSTPAADQGEVLPTVEVTEKAIAETAVKDGSVESGYRSDAATVGPLGQMPLKDAPYSVNVTPGELIENRGAHTEGDALMTNPTVSVSVAPNAPSASLSRMFIRGFNASDQSELRDGLVDRSFTIPPIENVDRIEVLNGLSSFLYGFASPGGAINYVSKQPTSDLHADLMTGFYGGGIGYAHADIGAPIDAEKRLRFRLNVYGEDGDTFIHDGKQKRDLVSGVVSYEVVPGTVVKGDFSHQDFELDGQQVSFTPYVTPSGQTIVPKPFDPSKQYGQDWTYTKSEKDLIGAAIDSRLNDAFSLRAAYRYGAMWRQYAEITDSFTATPGSYIEHYIASPRQTEVTNSGYALIDAKFATFDVNHKITFGYTGTEFNYQRGLDNNGIGPTTGYVLGVSSLSAPQNFAIPSTVNVNPGADVTTQMQRMDNFVVGDNIVFNSHWSVMAGASYSRNVVGTWGTTGNYTLAASNTNDAALTPSASLVFKPVADLTTYVTYMQGLAAGVSAPTTSGGLTITNANQVLPSSTSDQWEAGVKTNLGRVDLGAALFRIDKVNAVAEPLSTTTAVYAYDGREVHQGLEVIASGKLTDQLTFVGGFTAMSARVTDAPQYDGMIPVNVPEFQGRAYFEYQPWTPNLTFTAGANYDGRRPVDAANTGFIDGSLRFDAGIRYETMEFGHKLTVSLNALNLANEHYWLNSNGSLFLGAPRTLALTAKLTW
jgi:iron complex outermembrane receptor protein